MNTTRNGKIARLPREIRDQLSQRIENSQPGRKLIAWLNSLPEVQGILAEQFDSRPINAQNITEWRQGGYQDWLELQENRALTLRLAEQSGTLAADAGASKISEHFATIATAKFVRTAETLLKKTKDPKQTLACLDNILRQLSRLRRDDYRAGHLKLRQDRRNDELAAEQRALEEKKQAAEVAAEAEKRRQILTYYEVHPFLEDLARKSNGTDGDYDLTAHLLELKNNLMPGALGRRTPAPTPESEPSPASPSPDSTPEAPETRPDSAPIALANDDRSERETSERSQTDTDAGNREKMPGIRVNQAAGECSKMLHRERN